MTIGWILALWLQQTRSTKVLGAGAEEYRRVLSASGFMVLFVATFAYFTDTTRARGFVAGVAILGTLLILFARWLQRGVLQRALIAGAPIHRVFVVAPVSKSRHVVEELEKTGNRYSAVGQWTSFADHPDPRRIVREALARDAARGCDPAWIRATYSFAVKPTVGFYFRVPLEIAVERILEGRPELKYYEAGMDMNLSEDPYESFRLFQARIVAQYESMVDECGLTVIDGTLPIIEQQRTVRQIIEPFLDGLLRMPEGAWMSPLEVGDL